jgi:glucosyl-dolichyl phosphate glucuronosyltransferase
MSLDHAGSPAGDVAIAPRACLEITVIICTYNRCADLGEVLESVLAQQTGDAFAFEVLVIDNNSTDATAAVVERFVAAGHANVRYLREARQGKSYALSAGIQAARGAIYTVTDDDLILPQGWLRDVYDAFAANPDVAFVGGRVLPLWKADPPAWLTREHWSAIALADYGEAPFHVNSARPICLLACAFRLDAVRALGGYPGDLGVSGKRVGGTEDHDLLARMIDAGMQGLYLPATTLYHKVQPERVTRSYHRRWHRDHGRSHAVMKLPAVEASALRLFGVPAHLIRAAARDARGWLACRIRRDEAAAFEHETRLRFFNGFVAHRLRQGVLGAPARRVRSAGARLAGRPTEPAARA